ncbi:hypothetical protein TIFTF001_007849 [Ficus carica]|uniref:Uncharacterized protein n=1 Tax=Ficus carica TaxID=3494 RepID=A0AA87ZKB2_FICCA|nr:hypothetical protein TIFTF001_007849 [Ficus carica]
MMFLKCPLVNFAFRNIGSVIVTSLQDIVKTEGLRGMYRGLSPTILALLPNWAVYFTVYERLRDHLHSHVNENNELTIGANMVAAAGAGAATAITTNPLWVVKTRLQDALVRISTKCVEKHIGVVPSLVGISHVAIQFPAYEKIKLYMAKRENTTVDKLSPGSVAIASSISKVVASVLTYPHEVVRSRLQEQGQARNKEVQYLGVIDCVKKLFQREGLSGFYRGCATNLLRTTPSAVITFTSYEMIHRFLQRVIPPNKNHSQDYLKPNGHVDPLQGNGAMVKESNNHVFGQSQSQLNKRTPSIPLGSKEQLTRRH